MARTSIADILALVGGPGLVDSTPDARQRFRDFLCRPKWCPEDLQCWIDECLDLASRARSEFYLALQDIVISMGAHLGLEVEFGSYSGTSAGVPYDGRWRTTTDEDILVEVKSSPWPLGSTSQLGGYMDAHAQASGRDPSRVLGVYAIGTGDFSGLIDQIKGSEYRNRIKVISFDDLLRLFSLRTVLEAQMPLPRVFEVTQNLLLPFESVDVGGILDIIQGVVLASSPHADPFAQTEDRGAERDWRRSELRDFLDDCRPIQIAMLLALSSSPDCRLSGEDMVMRMSDLAPRIPGLEQDRAFTAKTIGGARSGLSKREEQAGKDSVMQSSDGCYALREECREWVAEWLTDQGLLTMHAQVPEALGGLFTADSVTAAG